LISHSDDLGCGTVPSGLVSLPFLVRFLPLPAE
jgi:hypothetical protein